MVTPFRIAALLVLVLAAAVCAALYVTRPAPVHVSTAGPPSDLARLSLEASAAPAPAVAYSDASGNRESIQGLRGRYVLLNLWATWCAPCVDELPDLALLKAQLPGLAIVAVNVGHASVQETSAFLVQHNASALGVHIDADAALIGAFKAQGLPLTVLIDPRGREIARAIGPCNWGTPAAVAYLRKLIAPAQGTVNG